MRTDGWKVRKDASIATCGTPSRELQVYDLPSQGWGSVHCTLKMLPQILIPVPDLGVLAEEEAWGLTPQPRIGDALWPAQ